MLPAADVNVQCACICSVMAVRLRNEDQQSASDALSTSLLIAGACGLATLFILEVTRLTIPLHTHAAACDEAFWVAWVRPCADAATHNSSWLMLAEMGHGAYRENRLCRGSGAPRMGVHAHPCTGSPRRPRQHGCPGAVSLPVLRRHSSGVLLIDG